MSLLDRYNATEAFDLLELPPSLPVVGIGQVFETRVWAELDATIECSRRRSFRVEMVATACR